MRGIEYKFAVVAMSSSVFFLVLVLCQPSRSFAQTVSPATQSQGVHTVVPAKEAALNSIGVPKPAAAPTAGTWNYNTEAGIGEQPKLNSAGTYSTTIKDDGGAWTVTIAMKFHEGPVTDVLTLEKGTLILRKELFKHFVHPDQRWKPVAISLDFTGNKVTGTSTNANGQDTPVAVDLSGPIFADATGSMVTISCLPLVDGYSTAVRDWDIEHLKERLWQLKVTGAEHVTVPAGTFDSYKVELTSTDGSGDRETVWIAKDSRMPIKVDAVDKLYGIIRTEMVPNRVDAPKPAASPMAGTWKYKATTVQPDGTYTATSSTTMKDDGNVWTVNNAYETPDGPVTDVLTLEKGTLILRGESLKHFPKAGRPWAVTIDLKFGNDKVSGHSNRSSGQNKSVEVDLTGPVSSEVTLGFLPLADGYTTPFPTWDVQALRERLLQLKVVGTERVTVPAGTFDAYKVELTSIPADSDKETAWIAKDSHMLVKASQVEVLNGGTIFTTTELVP